MSDLDIKEIRKKLGVSQTKLAEILGVHLKTVQNWEAGKVIPKTKYGILQSLLSNIPQKEINIEEKEKIQDPQRDELLSLENNDQIADLKKRIAELEATIQTLITSNNTLIATNKQLVNTIDRLTSDPGMPGNAMLIKTTKSTNGSIQPTIHVAELDNTKYQARKKTHDPKK